MTTVSNISFNNDPAGNQRLSAEVTFLVCGTYAGCVGSAPKEDAEIMVDVLKMNAVEGITFKKRLLTDTVSGGTSSAMSLRFLDIFFNYFENNPGLQMDRSSIIDAIKTEEIRLATESSSEELRIVQAAFNTMEKLPDASFDDFKRARMESIARHYNVTIDSASTEINLDDEANYKNQIKEVINYLPNGTYLYRSLMPSETKSTEEEKGHPCVFIKIGSEFIFYDPMYGTKLISNDDTDFEKTAEIFMNIHDAWTVPLIRFYGVKRLETVPIETVVQSSQNASAGTLQGRVHLYDQNSYAYNFFFHPLHFENTWINVAAIISNLILSLVTIGLWQIPFWIVNTQDAEELNNTIS